MGFVANAAAAWERRETDSGIPSRQSLPKLEGDNQRRFPKRSATIAGMSRNPFTSSSSPATQSVSRIKAEWPPRSTKAASVSDDEIDSNPGSAELPGGNSGKLAESIESIEDSHAEQLHSSGNALAEPHSPTEESEVNHSASTPSSPKLYLVVDVPPPSSGSSEVQISIAERNSPEPIAEGSTPVIGDREVGSRDSGISKDDSGPEQEDDDARGDANAHISLSASSPVSGTEEGKEDIMEKDGASEEQHSSLKGRLGADVLDELFPPSPTPLNSSLDVSGKSRPPPVIPGDACAHQTESNSLSGVQDDRIDDASFQEYSSHMSLEQDLSSDVFSGAFAPGPLLPRPRAFLMPICAVVGAETFLGSHVVQDLLREGGYVVRALVQSAAAASFLSVLDTSGEGLLSIVEIGSLTSTESDIPLRGALREVRCVINCYDALAADGKQSRVAERCVVAARSLSDAISAPGSSVLRLIHVGSSLSVFDPRRENVCRDGEAIEPELDENCWFAIDDAERKFSDPQAFGETASEMLLWSRASGDRAPYSMCSLVPSLLLGPIFTPAHANAAGSRLIADYISRVSAIPLLPMPVVDVRDVALSITKLVTSQFHVCGRVFMTGKDSPETSVELVDALRSLYPGFAWPFRVQARWAASDRVGVPWKMSRSAIKERRGRRYSLSNRRAVSEVGATFREIGQTLRDTVDSLQFQGAVNMHASRRGSPREAGVRLSSRLSGVGRRPSPRKTSSGRV